MNRRRNEAGRVAFATLLAALSAGGAVRAQQPSRPESHWVTRNPQMAGDMPDDQASQQIINITRDRPPQAEAAARAAVYNFAPRRFGNTEPLFIVDGVPQPRAPETGVIPVPVLDQLKAADLDGYWREVAQLVLQFDVFQRVVARDTARARTLAAMFGTEFEARVIQRAWRAASESDRTRMRSQLETLMTTHFEMEDRLRALEMQDIERRLADVRAETERRRQRRAEMVRWSVDDIIHGAERPEF